MDDLISRQAAIEKFEPWLKVEGYSEGELNMLKAVLYELRFLPSAQPQRMKGRWIHTSNIIGYGRCSACGSLWNESLVENKFFRFCPRCGADMRGGSQ